MDTSTGAFTVVNINTITITTELLFPGDEIQLGEAGQSFRTMLIGHRNAPQMLPTGWFSGYALGNKD